MINVNSLYHDLNTVHPLPRASILHLQGCHKGRTKPCPGCANEDLWSDEPKWLVDPYALARIVISQAAAPALSISGGEPLDQYEPLCHFLETLRKSDFSVLMWTGLEMPEVKRQCTRVLQLLDYLVTGPYLSEKSVRGTPFVASSNQRMHTLTEHGRKDLMHYKYVGQSEIVIPKENFPTVCIGGDLDNL